MEIIEIKQTIKVLCVSATSFPEGISAAHQKLHNIVPFSNKRRYFGLSRPENTNGIVYRAATEEIDKDEAQKYNCESLLIKSGQYASLTVNDYMKDPQSIERAFKQILARPDLDPEGYCVEWYLNDEKTVQCMVRLNHSGL